MNNIRRFAGGMAISALTLAAFAAQAQDKTNITIYGNIDLAIAKQSRSALVMDRGYNNWLGFKGEEKLDGDLAALFNLQMRFRPDTGAQETGVFWQGESTVGLKSNAAGTVRFGRALSPFWQQKWAFEPWYDSQLNGSLGAYQNGRYAVDASGALGFANYARMDNSVFYDSPTFGGIQVHLGGQVERQAGAPARTVGMTLNYQRENAAGMFSYERNAQEHDIYFLGGSYGIGAAAVMGSYAVDHQPGLQRQRNALIAATWNIGANTIRGGYGRNLDTDNNKVSVGVRHALSKRTNVYADVYREKTTLSTTGTAVGINHVF